MKKLFRIASLSVLAVSWSVPLLAAAQTGIDTTRIQQYSTGIVGVINNILVPVLMAIAFIVFLWGVYKYFILGATEEKSREDGRKFTLWGIIGFVVILSLWAFVNLIRGTFGLDNNATAPLPPTIWGTPSGVNASNQSAQNSPFGSGGGSPVYGQNGQPFVYGGSNNNYSGDQIRQLRAAYDAQQSACSRSQTSYECQNSTQQYINTQNAVNGTVSICRAEGATCTGSSGSSGVCAADGFGGLVCDTQPVNGNTSGGTTDFVGDIPVDNPGCMEPNAENYGGPSITRDDGSCTYATDVP